MTQKWVVFYVSSHGFGHMTRSLAVIKEIMEKTSYHVYLVCGKYQNDFARSYLTEYKDRIQFNDFQTDVGLVTANNSLVVDTKETEKQLINFVGKWEEIISNEVAKLKTLEIECIISDITPIGALVGKELNVRTIGLSNFTWVEQYEYFYINQEIIDVFKAAYSHFDVFIEYSLALPMKSITVPKKEIGFVARELNWRKISDLKQYYGSSIFISCGKAVTIDNIHVENYNGTIFKTSGVTVTGSDNVVELPTNTLDTHNYVAASDLVIAKAGWGTISEAITANKKMVLIERESVLEDSHNIQRLTENHVAISIKESELTSLDITALEAKADREISFERLNQYTNQKDEILEILGLQ
ncbi:hypothetical protein JTF06_13730 [Desemzia sp. RIT804]|uniref:glycosyltransferase n=1 Tax=Desemzia sp. RIT 804 TaxID=2810209 RepID=UPI00194E889F|nr:glycosyltransferase [Desemzia sp. RIT 804]MBM6615947.1 hypothetical protein [Desemzia sp. RIT 804]